jgi:hypothetical protein
MIMHVNLKVYFTSKPRYGAETTEADKGREKITHRPHSFYICIRWFLWQTFWPGKLKLELDIVYAGMDLEASLDSFAASCCQ